MKIGRNQMHTLTLNIEDGIYDKFSWLLKQFKSSEIQIVDEEPYTTDDAYLRSVSNMEKSIIDASNEPIENYVAADKLDW
jgi:hypothetical protein